MTCDTCNLPLHTSSKKLGRCSYCRHVQKRSKYREKQKVSGRIVGESLAKFYEVHA